jgi:hypothetical protein
MTGAPDSGKPDGGATVMGGVVGRRKISVGIVASVVVWLTLVCGATILMTRYSDTSGEAVSAPDCWPKDSRIAVDPARPTLLMFVHPHCPCTRASLGELDRLLAETSHLPNVQVVFVKPEGTASGWADTDLWRSASAIRGVKTYLDNGGVEARRFKARTSGQTLLYDRDGGLRFQGGITLARGHAGDNPGRTSLRELLEHGHADQFETPVYGCGLLDEQCTKGDVSCKR